MQVGLWEGFKADLLVFTISLLELFICVFFSVFIYIFLRFLLNYS